MKFKNVTVIKIISVQITCIKAEITKKQNLITYNTDVINIPKYIILYSVSYKF